MKIKIYAPLSIHEIGQRPRQEDSLYPQTADDSVRIFVLCDGIGGHQSGDRASQTVSRAIYDHIASQPEGQVLSDDVLLEALDKAWRELDKLDDGSVRKPGTTLTLLCLHNGGATMLHIGDSRIYHVRGADGQLLYQSRDHTVVMELYQSGEISYQEMLHSAQRHVLSRAMMPGIESRVRPDIVHTTDVLPGDWFFLCSDGMLEQMDNQQLAELLCDDMSDEEKRDRLVELTAGNHDNHTAWLIHIKEVTREAADIHQPNDEPTSRANALLIHNDADDDTEVELLAEGQEEDYVTQFADPVAKKKSSWWKSRFWIVALIALVAAVAIYLAFSQIAN